MPLLVIRVSRSAVSSSIGICVNPHTPSRGDCNQPLWACESRLPAFGAGQPESSVSLFIQREARAGRPTNHFPLPLSTTIEGDPCAHGLPGGSQSASV